MTHCVISVILFIVSVQHYNWSASSHNMVGRGGIKEEETVIIACG